MVAQLGNALTSPSACKQNKHNRLEAPPKIPGEQLQEVPATRTPPSSRSCCITDFLWTTLEGII